MTLFTKVVLTVVIVVTVALGVAGWIAGRGAVRAAGSYVSEVLRQQAVELAEDAAVIYAETGSWESAQEWVDDAGGGRRNRPGAGEPGAGRAGRTRWTLVHPTTGAALATDGSNADAGTLAIGAPVTVEGETVAVLAPVEMPGQMVEAANAFRNRVAAAIRWSALAAGLVALGAGGLLVASILRPLHQVERAVERIKQGDLSVRIERVGRDEIGRLAEGVNQMAAGLHEQEQLRQRLVSDIAHELRTPLSVIQGNLQAILDGVYPLDQAEVRVIFDETRLLARLVNDLHELAQAEAHRLPLAREQVDAAAALAATQERFRPLAEQKGIALRVEAAPGLTLLADPQRLQQVLHNLVGNALRHTPDAGAIDLSAQPQPGGVRLQVRDSGPGIAPADLPHIFDRFYRAERDRGRTVPSGAPDANGAPDALTSGTGLGLAIVKALVEAHGGRIGAESVPGRGATFWFTLPAA